MKKSRRRPLVLVEWIDSHSGRGWRRTEELAVEATPQMLCKSVGWIIAKTEFTTVLASSLSGCDSGEFREHASGDIAIPTGAIIQVFNLSGEPL